MEGGSFCRHRTASGILFPAAIHSVNNCSLHENPTPQTAAYTFVLPSHAVNLGQESLRQLELVVHPVPRRSRSLLPFQVDFCGGTRVVGGVIPSLSFLPCAIRPLESGESVVDVCASEVRRSLAPDRVRLSSLFKGGLNPNHLGSIPGPDRRFGDPWTAVGGSVDELETESACLQGELTQVGSIKRAKAFIGRSCEPHVIRAINSLILSSRLPASPASTKCLFFLLKLFFGGDNLNGQRKLLTSLK